MLTFIIPKYPPISTEKFAKIFLMNNDETESDLKSNE